MTFTHRVVRLYLLHDRYLFSYQITYIAIIITTFIFNLGWIDKRQYIYPRYLIIHLVGYIYLVAYIAISTIILLSVLLRPIGGLISGLSPTS